MSPEDLLLAGITAVTGALCYVSRLLWQKSEKCEQDRYELREEIEEVKRNAGVSEGTLKAYERCPQPNCPFKPSAALTGKVAGES